MKDLIILGNGVHAAEMSEFVARINKAGLTWRLLGFVAASYRPPAAGATLHGLPVMATADQLRQHPACWVAFEHDFHDPIDVPPERWASLIDPSSFVSSTAGVGGGCVIFPNCFVGHGVRLGRRVFVLNGSTINHDDVLEDNVTVCSGVSLAGLVHVETRCYLGQACTVRQEVRIGASSLIGMGSVVLNDVPPHSVMAGNPARRLRDNP